MRINVSDLIFYRGIEDTGISADIPTCTWIGISKTTDAEKNVETCFEASLDFITWPLFKDNNKLFFFSSIKVIYTDLWRFTKEELYNQINYNTNLINLEELYE